MGDEIIEVEQKLASQVCDQTFTNIFLSVPILI